MKKDGYGSVKLEKLNDNTTGPV